MDKKADSSVENYLMEFGLSREEVSLYISLLKSGRSSILELSKKTNIKRSTTHNYIESLIQKGVVSQTSYGGRRMIIAEVPEKLQSILDQKKWELKRLENNLPKIVTELYDLVPEAKEKSEVEVRYYEGEKGVKLIYDDALNSKELRSYVNLEQVYSVFPENGDLFVEQHLANPGLKIWEIVEDSEIARKNTKKFAVNQDYFYKFAPTSIELTSADVLIYDGKVAIVNVQENRSGFIIINKDYYDNTKAIFEFIWKMLPK